MFHRRCNSRDLSVQDLPAAQRPLGDGFVFVFGFGVVQWHMLVFVGDGRNRNCGMKLSTAVVDRLRDPSLRIKSLLVKYVRCWERDDYSAKE